MHKEIAMSATTIIRSMAYLHPVAMLPFVQLQSLLDADAANGQMPFAMFETYRTPERQQYLFDKKKTKARPWQSAHQYGLGVDFVPLLKTGDWTWEPPPEVWDRLRQRAGDCGLHNDIVWDRPHVYHPAFASVRLAL